LKNLGKIFFKYRSYTPLPFVFIMLFFINPSVTSIIGGFLVALLGELIRIWAVSFAGSETRTTSGVGGTQLVTQGPYSFTRNPLYIGNIMIYTGIGIMSNSLFPFLQLAGLLYFSFQYYCIILNEEGYLSSSFKDSFKVYLKSVNRFLPFKKVDDSIISKLDFDIKEGMKSENRSLQAFIITSVIILIFYFAGIRPYFYLFK